MYVDSKKQLQDWEGSNPMSQTYSTKEKISYYYWTLLISGVIHDEEDCCLFHRICMKIDLTYMFQLILFNPSSQVFS